MRFRAFAAASWLALPAFCGGCFVYGESLLEPTGSGGTGGGDTTTTTTTTTTGGSTGQPCEAPEDCPVEPSPCKARICADKLCGTEISPPNTEITDPTPGDCRGVICDSAGGSIEVEKSSDVPDDQNKCTLDLCEFGEPVHKPNTGFACGPTGMDVCNDKGSCVECIANGDCTSMVCKDFACAAASCTDTVKNNDETDVDCGGSCQDCATGKACALATDCKSGVCQTQICLPSCTDGEKNTSETDVDCGGACGGCADGQTCAGGGDCLSAICTATKCAAPTCSDGQKNAMETGVDCGGPVCPSCSLDHLVINEIDYDQPAADTMEFVEIYNATVATVMLTNIRLVLVNGSGNAPYKVIDLAPAGSLAAGQYLVVGAAAVTPAAGALKIDFTGATDQIQNGAPDAVALVDEAAGTVIDALSYEGAITAADLSSLGLGTMVTLVEGLAAGAKDEANAGSLCRLPSSKDTNNAAADWGLSTTPTPGAPNVP